MARTPRGLRIVTWGGRGQCVGSGGACACACLAQGCGATARRCLLHLATLGNPQRATAAACASHPFAASRTYVSAQTAAYHDMVPARSRRREDRERGAAALSAARSVCRASHMPWCASPTHTNVTARASRPQGNHHLPKPSPSHVTTPAPLRACVQWRGLPGPCNVKARAFLASRHATICP